MEQKYGEFVGVDSLYTADITLDANGNEVYGVPQYLAPVAEIAGEPEVSTKTTYYDNKAANNYTTEGKTELKITVSNVPANIMADILGKDYDVASGRVYDAGEVDPPQKAIGFRYNMGKNGYRYYWYLNGTFSGGAEEASSKSTDVDTKTYQLTYTAVTTTKQWTIGGILKSLKRIFADTANATFNSTGWFTQVQTPDTTGSPTEIALSSVVPTDGTETVAKDTTIALTFNNKISTENVALIDTTTGNTVTVTRAWDTTGKILTLTPSVALTGTTKYIVSIAGVKDIYGQILATTSIDFTTVA